MVSILASGPPAPGLIPSIPQIISKENIIVVADVNQQRWFEKSGQWLENVDWTHLVLASGKPVLQKTLAEEEFQGNQTQMYF